MTVPTHNILRIDLQGGAVHLSFHAGLAIGIVVAGLTLYGLLTRKHPQWTQEFEIDEAELGVGNHKLKLRRNTTTVQVAYKLWVELSTRKLGLPIDLEHDVIVEIYTSWYGFFRVTRELLKEIAAGQLRNNKSTRDLVGLAIKVLNQEMRSHLTQWQARFRRWYAVELNHNSADGLDPQDLQRRFPRYAELKADLLKVNNTLIAYRAALESIVFPV